jgi:hypothetical protein
VLACATQVIQHKVRTESDKQIHFSVDTIHTRFSSILQTLMLFFLCGADDSSDHKSIFGKGEISISKNCLKDNMNDELCLMMTQL